MINLIISLYMSFITVANSYSYKNLENLNFILKTTLGADLIVSCLRQCQEEAKMVQAVILVILCGTVDYSKISTVFTQRIENSVTPNLMFEKFLECVHTYGFSSKKREIFNLGRLEEIAQESIEVYEIKANHGCYIMIQEGVHFDSYSVTSNKNNIYRWEVFQMDDLKFDCCVEHKFNLGLQNSIAEEPMGSPRRKEAYEKEEESTNKLQREGFNGLSLSVFGELKVGKKSSITFDSSKNLRISLDGLQSPVPYTPLNSASKRTFESTRRVISDLDYDSVDSIFEAQESIEEGIEYDQHKLNPEYYLFGKDEALKGKKDHATNCRMDEQHAFFHGIACRQDYKEISIGFQAKQLFSKFFKPSEVILTYKCYSSRFSEDPEFRNLTRALGVPCDPSLVDGGWNEMNPSIDLTMKQAEEQGDCMMLKNQGEIYFYFMNSKLDLLKRILEERPNIGNKKDPSSVSSVLILYGNELDITNFREKNLEILRKFTRLIILNKTYDYHVVHMKIIEVQFVDS